MLEPNQDQALRELARSVRLCLENVGAECTAHLLAALAMDLDQAAGSGDLVRPPSTTPQPVTA